MRKNTVGLNDPPEMVYRSTESWEYYEDRTGEIYDISYIEDVFTPLVTWDSPIRNSMEDCIGSKPTEQYRE